MTLRKPDLVLFDLDGTLVNTAPDLTWSIDAMLEQLELPVCGEDKVRAWVGNGIEGLLKRALTNDFYREPEQSLYDMALSSFRDIYFDNLCSRR